jgi:signal transduction histidine kinase
VAAGLTMAALGYAGVPVFHTIEHSVNCTSSAVRALGLCSFGASHRPLAQWLLGGAILLVILAVCLGLALWVMRPLASLTAMIGRMGPQNLAERGEVGPQHDEITALTEAVNAMMNRFAEGYEGQRSFAANASHELRTPLAVQRTLIEVSMANARSPEQIELLTEQLLATNERNERLIEGLLVLSESDRGLAARTPQRLDEITAAVVDTHRELATQAGVALQTSLEPRVVAGEGVLLERLVSNLVRNAITYNIKGGTVSVSVSESPALVVENTGAPIAAESVAGLFEPLRRGTADRTHHGGGAGLGLTIVRSICRAHDGAVDAHAGPDGGLRVEVALP